MNEKERYENVDMPFYRDVISPFLPDDILDFHTHVWKKDQWILKKEQGIPEKQNSASLSIFPTAKYMSTELEYGIDDLIRDTDRMFPLQRYHSVLFGQPTPTVDTEKTNIYIADNAGRNRMYPLIVAGKDLMPKGQLKQMILEHGFFGYKVYLDWVGNDYGNICVDDMIGADEMELANELGLVVLLHVPRSGRLADPVVSRGVRNLAKSYPEARIVLAHCGRCYRPEEMFMAIDSLTDLENVYLDTAMVMDPTVLHTIFSSIDPKRVLYATDFPIAAMRGRRVNVMDHWVDIVLEGYPESDFRVGSDNIRATFMAYEIILAIKTATETAGISKRQLEDVFFNNGMRLLDGVKGEKQSAKIARSWKQAEH